MNAKRALIRFLGPPAITWTRHFSKLPFTHTAARAAFSYCEQYPHDFVSKTRYGFTLEGNSLRLVDRHVRVFGQWEPVISKWIAERLQEGDGFIDIGAYIGYYTVLASRRVGPTGRVIAVEALPPTQRALAENLRRNRCENVSQVNLAVTDQPGTISIHHGPADNPSETTIMDGSGPSHESKIPCDRLSNVVSVEDFKRTRIVKMDIEGAEWPALKGMKELLPHARQDLEMIVEVNEFASGEDGSQADRIIGFLSGYGFHPYQIENDYTFAPYLRRGRVPRPERVRDPKHLANQADLVFSRRDASCL